MDTKNIKNSISLEDWSLLYKEAIEFKELAPWNWMWDSDLFGVKNPVNGEIGYCCVLGGGKQVFGLAVYLGNEGLDGYLRISEGKVDVEDDNILHLKKCLLLSYDNKQYVTKTDLEVMKNLELEFKGRNAWPLFRSYEPGYYPWYLTKEQVQYLILCLQQAKGVSLRFKEKPDLFNPHNEDAYFVRMKEDIGDSSEWKDAWFRPKPLMEMVVMVKSIDIQRLENIKKKASQKKQTWEVDSFYSPSYVGEKGKRPYFPIALLFVDTYSYFILNVHLTTYDKYQIELYEHFLKTIEKIKIIPEEIWVSKKELFVCLEQIAMQLGIKVRLVKKLQAVGDVRKNICEYFGKQR